MDIDPQIQQLAVGLADSAVRNSAQFISDKVTTLRAKNQDKETIVGLEAIVNDLISDKNELVRIAQGYQAELVAQRISSGDVRYITENVIPVLRKLSEASNSGDQTEKFMELLEPLLSVETVNVMQLLGFNFRRAIGEPLTEAIANAISSRGSGDAQTNVELLRLSAQREILMFEIAKDPDAFIRLQRLYGNG